ncbi:MAG: TIGR04282 family arsenosugar biosynthesis glycosyltransferase [Chitinophagales bacterium]|nr:TIGR04282 family arsenosugar biosynthesis glycosyltransferase [Chitinophagales bacterium]MDW8428120.1 TIGR04282 family arsenosugar biosynthesis glycosyltransferase [Chitinophagales bacterium]
MNRNTDELLIVFVRNAISGKVKTRLARTLGADKALEIYRQLLDHTHRITCHLPVDKAVFYSDFIEQNDLWNHQAYLKQQQKGGDLGKRMLQAFRWAFGIGYKKVVLIGSDTFQLRESHLTAAFDHLNRCDVVIGPAHDGGYYLIGMKQIYPALFKSKKWSSDTVLHATLEDLRSINGSYHLLEELVDIDTEEDLHLCGQL